MDAENDKLQAFEMWIWRRLENISWEQKIRNEEVLRRVKENRCLNTIILFCNYIYNQEKLKFSNN